MTEKVCPNLPEEKKKKAKRTEAISKLKRYVGRLDVDSEFKSKTLADLGI